MVLGDFLWTLFVLFFMVIYFMMLFTIITDIFRDHTLAGWAKAAWFIFILFIPFLSMLIYLIARGSGMAKRNVAAAESMKKQQDDYIRNVANSSDDPSDQIARAHALLTQGAITQAEFDSIKAKVLAGTAAPAAPAAASA